MRISNLVNGSILVLLLSCSTRPALEGFDKDAWSNDRNGCNGTRRESINTLLKQKQKLLALDELEIVAVMGKPDAHEIYKRSEKFFYYSVDPDSTCGDDNMNGKRLVIRFNAVGLAKEITLE